MSREYIYFSGYVIVGKSARCLKIRGEKFAVIPVLAGFAHLRGIYIEENCSTLISEKFHSRIP